MTRALLFGAIGTLAETSEQEREAFNAAFADAGLDWAWSEAAYGDLLTRAGGDDPVSGYAAARDVHVDAGRLRRRQAEIFNDRIIREGLAPRSGVVQTIATARAAGLKTGLVTTTGYRTVEAGLTALRESVTRAHFDFIGDRSLVEAAKPDPAIYHLALERLGVAATGSIAIEDAPEGVEAARRAGIPVVAFPGLVHRDRPFPGALLTTETLDFARLRSAYDAA